MWVIDHPDAKDLNARIRKTIHELEEHEYKARARGEAFDLAMIPNSESAGGDFTIYMKQLIESEKLSVGNRRQHRSTLNHLLDFGKIIKFSHVTRHRIQEFNKYLQEKGMEQSTIYATHKRLRKLVRKVLADGNISSNPYDSFSVPAGNRGHDKVPGSGAAEEA